MERLALRELSSQAESFCGSICLISTEAGEGQERQKVISN